MSQYLPVGGFKWATDEELLQMNKDVQSDNHDFILNMEDECLQGAIFEVDLSHPHLLHEEHNGYPLAPEKISIPFEWLSTTQLLLLESHKREMLIASKKNFIGPIKPRAPKNEKLVSNLFNKE